MPRICQDEPLSAADEVIRRGSSPPERRLPFHPRLVTFEKGDVVSLDRKLRHLELARRCATKRVLGFIKAFEKLTVEGKLQVPDWKIWIDLDRFRGGLD